MPEPIETTAACGCNATITATPVDSAGRSGIKMRFCDTHWRQRLDDVTAQVLERYDIDPATFIAIHLNEDGSSSILTTERTVHVDADGRAHGHRHPRVPPPYQG